MARPFFIFVPSDLVEMDKISEMADSGKLQLVDGNWPRPKLESIYVFGYDSMLKRRNLEDNVFSKMEYKKFNSNDVFTEMDKCLREVYQAQMVSLRNMVYGSCKLGSMIKMYVDGVSKKAYFYTMQRYKSKRARHMFGGEKTFVVRLYSLPSELVDFLIQQKKHIYKIEQLATGLKIEDDRQS